MAELPPIKMLLRSKDVSKLLNILSRGVLGSIDGWIDPPILPLHLQGLRMMQLSKGDGDGEKAAALPSLTPASALGEYMPGDLTEFSPDGALVAVMTSASKTLRWVYLPACIHVQRAGKAPKGGLSHQSPPSFLHDCPNQADGG